MIIKGGGVSLHALCGNVQSFLQAYIKQANKFIRGFGCCDNHIVSIRGVNMFGYIQLYSDSTTNILCHVFECANYM